MDKVFHALHRWFAERDIDTRDLTVILNFGDRQAAVRFDMALRKDIEKLTDQGPVDKIDIRQFEMMGIKVKLESPVHGPHSLISDDHNGPTHSGLRTRLSRWGQWR
jgi:hypothetical protein